MAGVLGMLWPSSASGAPDAQRQVVAVEVNAAEDEAGALAVELGDVMQHFALHMRLERRSEPPLLWPSDVLASVWIDASHLDWVTITVIDLNSRPDGQRYVRTLVREGSVAVLTEQVAQVVRASLESILTVDVERPSSALDAAAGPLVVALPEARPAAASKATAPGVGLDFGAAVTEQAVSPNSGPIFGVEAAVRISLLSRRLGLVASGAYAPRFAAQDGPAVSEVSVASFRVIPSIELIDLDTFGASLGGGGGGDLFSVAPLVVKRSMATIDKAVEQVDPVVSGQLVLHLRLAEHLALMLAFDLDYDLSNREAASPPRGGVPPGPAFEPWRLRPMVAFGACLPFTAAGACASAHP
jgi:hypothetical protein